MNDIPSLLAALDTLCGQIAAALSHSQPQLYATIALVLIASALLFPPKDDPDQI